METNTLEKEVAEWAFFFKSSMVVFNRCLHETSKEPSSWGLPIVTTTAGMRGYRMEKGFDVSNT